MMTLEDLLKLPEELLEKAHAALVERRNNRYRAEEAAVAQRLKLAEAGHGDFKDGELTYGPAWRTRSTSARTGHGIAARSSRAKATRL
jgi:hypothetical protein